MEQYGIKVRQFTDLQNVLTLACHSSATAGALRITECHFYNMLTVYGLLFKVIWTNYMLLLYSVRKRWIAHFKLGAICCTTWRSSSTSVSFLMSEGKMSVRLTMDGWSICWDVSVGVECHDWVLPLVTSSFTSQFPPLKGWSRGGAGTSKTSPCEGIKGSTDWEETPGQTLNTLEGLHIPSGLETP